MNLIIIRKTGNYGKTINAGPKVFAARIGLILATTIIVFLIFSNAVGAMIFAGILGFFSFMEAVFNFCVACKIYPYILPVNALFDRSKKIEG